MTRVPVVILGAGPAGLGLGRALGARGIQTCLLERGAEPGTSWQRMRDDLRLGPWHTNLLPDGDRISWWWRHRLTPRSDFHRYLTRYATRHRLDVRTETTVARVEAIGDDGFGVVTSGSDVEARVVVNATGYFSSPRVPEAPGLATATVPWLHTADYRGFGSVAEHLRGTTRRVLVVGTGVSAGEALLDLDAHDCRVEVSVRTPLTFGRPLWAQVLAGPLYFWLEDRRVHRTATRTGPSARPMDGGRARRLIERGDVALRPAFVDIDGSTVVFGDGTRETFDLVIFATGYRPALDHLATLVSLDPRTGLPALDGMESRERPGLFFLGLDGLRSFRSRFVRGIREDAEALADLVAERLGH